MPGKYEVPGPRPSFWSRVRGKLLFIPAVVALLIAVRRRSRTELWIGDSHAMSFNRSIVNSMFMRGPAGQLIFRVGARLMWSIAANGFPSSAERFAKAVGRMTRPGTFVPVFCAGEIDVRAHLAEHTDDGFGFVASYVDRCRELTSLLKADRSAYMVPPPPAKLEADEVWFPIVGTHEERLKAFQGLREALATAVGEIPGAVIIDCSAAISDSSGGLRPDLTDDGCHTNLAAVAIAREVVDGHHLLVP